MENTPGSMLSDAERFLTALQQLLALDMSDARQTLNEAAIILSEILQAEKVDCFILDDDQRMLFALGTSETPLAHKQRAIGMDRLPLANGGVEVGVFQSGHSYRTHHAEQDPQMLIGVTQGLGIRSLLAVPLTIATKRRGAIVVSSTEPGRFTDTDLTFLETVAYWVGLLLYQAALQERVATHERSQERLDAALLTVLHHDISVALDLQRTLLSTLQQGTDGPQTPISHALKGIAHMQRLLTTVHEVRTGQFTTASLSRQTIDVIPLVATSIAAVSTPDVPVLLECDLESLLLTTVPPLAQQAIENLLDYAVEHSPQGTPVQVSIDVERDAADEPTAFLLTVEDAGPPLPLAGPLSDQEAKHQPISVRQLGVMMYLVEHIMTVLGGDIAAERGEPQGTIFTLRFPLMNTSVAATVAAPTPLLVYHDQRSRDLTDAEWQQIQSLLPAPKEQGRKRSDLRRVINGILYILDTGIAWRKLPRRYGNNVTCWRYYICWQGDGTWRRLQQQILAQRTPPTTR